jgi:hypothetical protein
MFFFSAPEFDLRFTASVCHDKQTNRFDRIVAIPLCL